MKMLNILVLGLSFVLNAQFVSAQEKSKMTPEQRAEMHTSHMAKHLDLNEEQKAKVAIVNTGIAQKNDAIRNSDNMTIEQKQDAIKMNMDARKSMMKNILTEEQFKKFEAHESEMHMKKMEKKELPKKKENGKKENQPPLEEL